MKRLTTLAILVISWSSVIADEKRDEFANVVRNTIMSGRLVVRPHDFNETGYIQGGIRRTDAETDHGSPFMFPIDTLCLLEAKIVPKNVRLTADQRRKLDDGCRKQIEAIVKEQLALIPQHKGKPNELRDKLKELQSKAEEVFASSAKGIGFSPRFEGDQRWSIRFVPQPAEGATVYFMTAGDYDIALRNKQKGLAEEVPWVPAGEQQRLGDGCQYYVCAKWENGAKSEVKQIRVTKDDQVELKPKLQK